MLLNIFVCKYPWVEMTNKPARVGIVWTRSRFDRESPYWLGMGM